jgi:SAM-dependent methyltransferase
MDQYTSAELRLIAARVGPREGWDFSRMNTSHPSTPWDYATVVTSHLRSTDCLIDVGTGGGERLLAFRGDARLLVGVDPDRQMIEHAERNAVAVGATNVHFRVGTVAEIHDTFDVAINRHAPFEPAAIRDLLPIGGTFITQQVGEHNMANVKAAFHLTAPREPIVQPDMFTTAGFTVLRFDEYDLDYALHDIDSLIFWLQALDVAHSDFVGFDPGRDSPAINDLLSRSLTAEGLITNEHRYLLVATRVS